VSVEFNVEPQSESKPFYAKFASAAGLDGILGFYSKLRAKILGGPQPNIGENASKVFTYSLFYVFYDQYTYIRGVLAQNTMLGLAIVCLSIQIIASLQISIIITLCVFLTMFNLMGVMWMLNEMIGGYPIEINAVFVVNLVTTLGFGVEFCNHIGMNFMKQLGTKRDRAMKSLGEMGPSVVVGIVSTKFLGVIVLAFAPSTLFSLYYFRMYLFIIVCGAFNGLMLMPILLTYIGP
jgi:Niemann-Pick C1 protein